ncbi:FYDLN acid domain-containing protein [Kordiimonas lipolytica]|uniref:FYDLN acid domain-containing protein n=1 Tax=Kordiimonas lipolytica TaxID=1662421 RepID=A0ABV8UE66_9PROT|nr:FYDLN acid domain-containing protein [Kordiimonas lipolytica]
MAKPEWGTKRTCPKCGTRFYDLGKDDPATCIDCGNQWAPEPVLKAKQPVIIEDKPAKEADKDEDDVDLDDEDDIDIDDDDDVLGDVSLDDDDDDEVSGMVDTSLSDDEN